MTVNKIIINIETMDTMPSALILTIGAFAFDVTDLSATQQTIIDASQASDPTAESAFSFYRRIDSFNQLLSGRTVSIPTQQWWKQQGEDAQEALTGERVTLGLALSNLNKWLTQHKSAQIFFRGTDFDGAILEDAYRGSGIDCPWKYNGKRDIRTYIDAMVRSEKGYIKGHQPCFPIIEHHSLHDAMNDAEQMATAYMMNDGNTRPAKELKKVTA
ncbi:3'-5' exonuclease [Rouxiella badensis]|uniref:3'-5' exonuclease n=1 Tax=Rouxiella badensis TaxID=1646377 RepID=UPI003C3EBAD3